MDLQSWMTLYKYSNEPGSDELVLKEETAAELIELVLDLKQKLEAQQAVISNLESKILKLSWGKGLSNDCG